MSAKFPSLYNYSSEKGVTIPDTPTVKALVVQAFAEVFGTDVSTDPETPMGRFVEALTLLFVNVLGVNAQNANFLDPTMAAGEQLDRIGNLFGVTRPVGASDARFRELLLASQSRGIGFPESIRRAVSSVYGVEDVVVWNNGTEDPMMCPNERVADGGEASGWRLSAYPYAVEVRPHSVFVSVRGGSDAAVAEAINSAVSLGCGMECSDPNAGRKVEVTTSAGNVITFFRPNAEVRAIGVKVAVYVNGYNGGYLEADVRAKVVELVASLNHPGIITAGDLARSLTASGIGVLCTSALFVEGSGASTTTKDEIVVYPKDDIQTSASDVEVTVL